MSTLQHQHANGERLMLAAVIESNVVADQYVHCVPDEVSHQTRADNFVKS